MIRRGVWRHKKRSEVPSGRTLVGSKWVFKIKNNGTYRSRLVALGYSQVPGLDYTENFAPVVNDVTFRLALVIGLIKKWKMKNLDVETAFLEGKLENAICMKMPPGYEKILESLKDYPSFAKILANWDKDTVGELGRCIYGLVQASRQWYKTMAEVLTKKLGFSRSMKDPCLFY